MCSFLRIKKTTRCMFTHKCTLLISEKKVVGRSEPDLESKSPFIDEKGRETRFYTINTMRKDPYVRSKGGQTCPLPISP